MGRLAGFKYRQNVLLIILDGFGISPSDKNNAVVEAPTPYLDQIFANNPHNSLQASGAFVGLPDGQMGNSEVGHSTLGTGCIMQQNLVLIDNSIKDKSFFKNPALLKAIQKSVKNNRPLHLLGLTSDGGVHSHINHLIALLDLCKQQQARPILHIFTDGRDTNQRKILKFLQQLKKPLLDSNGVIGTISGRYYAMDRDNRWDRIKKIFDAIIHNTGVKAKSAENAIQNFYDNHTKLSDEFIEPIVLSKNNPIKPTDGVICFNFRADRSRQLVESLINPNFNGFARDDDFDVVDITCMTEYDKKYSLPIAFKPISPPAILSKIISDANLHQFHCAETEKYAHVTYFFNGGQQHPFKNEKYVLVKSPQVATYDLKPEMSADKITDNVIEAIKSGKYSFIVTNFANGDMVGHTAIKDAIIKAVQTLDTEVGRMVKSAKNNNFSIIITADHGNCEEYIDPITSEPQTQHTCYPVPVVIIDKDIKEIKSGLGLSSIAPTILEIMGLEQPAKMTGKSLIKT
ncbi:MAG: 2,3-bisphosphoglycerate-independent phosphoglycerate mutase [Gammaproteobacteria bacterium]|nr:MAG: 2,3-bisphosphoglycerate-independent phosphoglycerate mutase [Gammaproteobacteria bacterium]